MADPRRSERIRSSGVGRLGRWSSLGPGGTRGPAAAAGPAEAAGAGPGAAAEAAAGPAGAAEAEAAGAAEAAAGPATGSQDEEDNPAHACVTASYDANTGSDGVGEQARSRRLVSSGPGVGACLPAPEITGALGDATHTPLQNNPSIGEYRGVSFVDVSRESEAILNLSVPSRNSFVSSSRFCNPAPSTFFPPPSTPSTSRSVVNPPPISVSSIQTGVAPSNPIQDDLWVANLRRQNRENMARRRANLSELEQSSRLALSREQYLERISRMSSEERSLQLERAQQRSHQSRASASLERAAEISSAAVQRRRNRELSSALNLFGSAFFYRADIDYSTHPKISIGSMSKICQYCSAKSFQRETDGMCCANGKVRVERIQPPPEPYLSLFSGDTPDSLHFLKHILRYNNCFQMTSFGVKGKVIRDGYMPTFRLQGQIYHRIGSLMPMAQSEPAYLQVYFMGDSEAQIDHRYNRFRDTKRNIVALFQELFINHNILVREFRSALERMPSDQHQVVIRSDRTPAGEHERRFNSPASEEVSMVVIDSGHYERDIVIQRKDHRLKRINEMHPSYDALQYPMIFWRGNYTYDYSSCKQVDPRTGLPTNKKVSTMDYYAYQLMLRDNDVNFIFMCRSLLNQFVVDMFAKVEAERLRFLRLNQAALRVSEYIHLRDAIAVDGIADEVGQQFILPSSFIGSPRHMHEYSQDAMAYVRLYGRPDLFITFTCNADWPEIQLLLMPTQKASDRHDLTTRVFRQKLLSLMDLLSKHCIFGPCKCFMYSIEWQKRGLPHAHILIWLDTHIRPEQIDSIISAELPDPVQDPVLFDIVVKRMRHGPCGRLKSSAPCNDKHSICTKQYPKSFLRETQTEDNGFPKYRRRSPEDGGQSIVIGDFTVDNRWIVPYSPMLCKTFNAHINVEFCNSVQSIKYICNYINKGSDLAIMEINTTNQRDEIERFQMGRYLCTSEAFWRLYGFRVHDRHPTVVHLAVHLENGQRVYFNTNNAESRADDPPATTLTGYFSLCQTDPDARSILYTDLPRFYTWQVTTKRWKKRQQGTAIGRMYTVHPNQGECFYLRMLLTKVVGSTSFEDLRTFEGRVCSSYREACLLRGLLESDSQWIATMREAALSRSPSHLRHLFALILCFCSPGNPDSLWIGFRDDLSEDILMQQRRNNPTLNLDYTDSIYNQALLWIEDICLRSANRDLKGLGMSAVPCRSNVDQLNSELMREMSYNSDDMHDYVSANLPQLVEDQRMAFDGIVDAIENERGGLFFLDAPGGTGKTFLINLILAHVRQKGDIILAVASSGIASTLLAGGRTAHSVFQLPFHLHNTDTPVCNIRLESPKASVLKQCKAVIWDECTMSHKKSLEAVDRLFKDVRRNSSLMGGVVVVLAGDFRQTLPVIRRGTPADELDACLKQSYLWRYVQRFSLRTNMRAHLRGEAGAEEFSSQLLEIGGGTFPAEDSIITLPASFCRLVSSDNELIDRVFPDIQRNFANRDWLNERAILAPLNDCVDAINLIIQDRLPGQSRTYLSIDSVEPEQAVNFPTEFLNSLIVPGIPQHSLTLKIGSPIMLMRNLDPPRLCNGTRLVVKSLATNSIEAIILAGSHKGEIVFIPRIPLKPTELAFSFKRLQFPVRLAYCMTINKSQGQSLKVVGIKLNTHCFSHGQLYVACSRVGSPSNMFVLAPGGKAKNIVYQAALRD